MRNVRYIARLIVTFLSRFKLLIALGIISGLLIFFALSIFFIAFRGNRVERIGLVGRHTVDRLPAEILNLIGDGLTQIDEKGDVTPNLASSWETPDRGKTWIFYLRDNLTWQDGDKIVSKDINYQFTDLETEKPDDKTLVFKLKDSYSAFPAVVSKPVFKKGLLGTGEWRVRKISLAGNILSQITLENKDKDKLIYRFYPAEERAKLGFKLGEVDEVRGLIDPTPFDEWSGLRLMSGSFYYPVDCR